MSKPLVCENRANLHLNSKREVAEPAPERTRRFPAAPDVYPGYLGDEAKPAAKSAKGKCRRMGHDMGLFNYLRTDSTKIAAQCLFCECWCMVDLTTGALSGPAATVRHRDAIQPMARDEGDELEEAAARAIASYRASQATA